MSNNQNKSIENELMCYLNPEELSAVRSAVRGSIDLYRGYIKLNPESLRMKQKQGKIRKRLALLLTAQKKLK